MIKICIKCNKEKDDTQFALRKDTGKHNNICIECQKLQKHNYYKNNIASILDNVKIYRKENKLNISIKKKNYYNFNKEIILNKSKNFYEENKENIREVQKEYYENNKDQIISRTQNNNKNYRNNRRKIDPEFKLRGDISSIIRLALKSNGGDKKGHSVMKYLPYSIRELKEHLEKQFESWMTWQNHGSYNRKYYDDKNTTTWTWHIDHIIPQSKLLYSSMEDDNFHKCWSLENLRPLKSIDNIKKGDKLLV